MVGDDGGLVLLNHDLEAFVEEIQVHGIWNTGIQQFASQLELSLNEGVSKPAPVLSVESPADEASVPDDQEEAA